MKHLNKLLTALLLLCCTVASAHDFEVDGIYYNILSSETVEVTYKGDNSWNSEYSGDVTIPSSVFYDGVLYDVVAIGWHAFNGCYNLTSITIPNSVTSIGDNAFNNCDALTSIVIPNSVTNIEHNVFHNCDILENVIIGSGVETMKNNPFVYCSALESIVVSSNNTNFDSRENCNAIIETATNTLIAGCKSTVIPTSVTSIGDEAFYGCYGLTSITIPNSVTSIGDQAFNDCDALTSIVIPNSVTNIEYGVFYSCDILENVIIGSGVETMQNNPFAYCSALESIVVSSNNTHFDSRENCNAIIKTATNTLIAGCKNSVIPGSVTSIGVEAFYNCSGLTSITIPNSVETIGSYAFFDCNALTDVIIGIGVTAIETNAFGECNALENIVIASENTVYDSRENSNAIIETVTNTLIRGCVNTIIPNTITTIGHKAFEDCSTLESIVIPNSVTKIESFAFEDCYALENVTIPNSVTEIGDYAFGWCSSLSNVTIPNSVTEIGDYAFGWCSSLPNVTIPNSVTSVDNSAFHYSLWYNNQPDGLLYLDGWLLGYKGDKPTGSIVIADGTKCIGNQAFSYCSGLTSITIPNSVTSIGDEAFEGCSGLTSVTIGTELKTVGEEAFYGCNAITNLNLNCNTIGDWFRGISSINQVTIGDNVATIGDYAFYNCDGITSISIPNNVTTIGESAFSASEALTNITIGSGVETIGNSAFNSCKALANVTIPNSVKTIGNFAFSGCSALEDIIIPNSVTKIGNNAFSNCSKIKSITIPASVTSIGLNPIYNSTAIENIVVASENTVYDSRENCNAIIETATNKLVAGCKNSTIPGNITIIGEEAFGECKDIISIDIPNSVTTIEEYAFGGCTGLTSIQLPNSVTYIADYAFSFCTELANISIPDGVTYIGESAFEETVWYNNQPNGLLYLNNWLIGYKGSKPSGNLKIADGTVGLAARSLHGCDGITNVEIPNTVVTIGSHAFYNCSSLTSILLPSSLKTIGYRAFLRCLNITSITIPSGVTTIEDAAFVVCPALESIVVESGNSVYDSRNNCNAIIETASNKLIAGCKNTIFPNNITAISDNAFNNCYDLTDIEIPNSVTSIGKNAFYNCTNLTNVTIGNGLTNIGPSAFGMCEALKSVRMASEMPETGDAAFNSEKVANVVLTVPHFAKSDYESTAPWSDFGTIEAYCFFVDGREYAYDDIKDCEEVVYHRTFNNTNWQAWYMPFDVDYIDVESELEVACLNNIDQYDDNKDGEIDRTEIEIIPLTGGTLYANYPYVVRAKNTGAKEFLFENVDVQEFEENSIDCSSVATRFVFTGNHKAMNDDNCYKFDASNNLVPSSTVDYTKAVTAIEQLNDNSVYVMRSERAFLLYSSNGEVSGKLCTNTGTSVGNVTRDASDVNQQFMIENVDGAYYLYSIGAGKYVGAEGNYTATATTPLNFENVGGDYKWKLSLGDLVMNSQVPGHVNSGIIVNDWRTTDAGNCYLIEECFSLAPNRWRLNIEARNSAHRAPARIKLFVRGDNISTEIDEVETDDGATEVIYDLQGRRIKEIAKPGVYVVDGKKMFVM